MVPATRRQKDCGSHHHRLEDVRQMRRTGILALTLLMLGACGPEERADPWPMVEGPRGRAVVFKSNDGQVMALYPDGGSFRFYGDVLEVGGPSDLGGDLEPCGEGISKCVYVGDSAYFMVPPPGEARWYFGGYDFHVVADPSDREGQVVTVSRAGDESYSYGFSSQCGVKWINHSTGGQGGERLYSAVGPSLFSEADCTPAPTG